MMLYDSLCQPLQPPSLSQSTPINNLPPIQHLFRKGQQVLQVFNCMSFPVMVTILCLPAVGCKHHSLLAVTDDPAFYQVILELQEVVVSSDLISDQAGPRYNVVHDSQVQLVRGRVLLELALERALQLHPARLLATVDVAQPEQLRLHDGLALAHVVQALLPRAVHGQRAVRHPAIQQLHTYHKQTLRRYIVLPRLLQLQLERHLPELPAATLQ